MMAIISLLMSTLLGGMVVYAFFLRGRALAGFTKAELGILLPAAVGAGLCVRSLVGFWIGLIGGVSNPYLLILCDCILAAGLASLAVVFRAALSTEKTIGDDQFDEPLPEAGPIRYLFYMMGSLIVIGGCVYAFYVLTRFPHGTWDAWAIWNLRARFLAAGAGDGSVAFSPILGWSHPDYPLLLPTLVARQLGRADFGDPLGARVLAGMFLLMTGMLLWGTVARFKGKFAALLAVGVLFSCQTYVFQSASQCADIPMAFFILLTFAMVMFAYEKGWPHGCWYYAMAGGFLATVAWTKNEGLLFVVVFLGVAAGAVLLKGKREGLMKSASAIAVGGLLPALTLIYFKVVVAPKNDLVDAFSFGTTWEKITSIDRHVQVLELCAKKLLSFGDWPISLVLVLIVFAVLVRKSLPDKIKPAVVAGWLIILIVFFGYYGVYLTTPHDVAWHINTSWQRLICQYFPAVLMLLFIGIDLSSNKSNQAELEPAKVAEG